MNKGFTLMELIAVIVILAITSMIVFPNISAIIYTSTQSLHDEQIKDIEKSAEKWATDYYDLLDPYHLNIVYISLSDIQAMGYLEKENVTDPLTKQKMDGCIQIKYNKYYEYHYKEDTCLDYAKEQYDESLGYVIYQYDSASKNIVEAKDDNGKSMKYTPTGLALYEYYLKNNMLYTDGETSNGLYELDKDYVFRGSEVNNYVEFAGKTWRILSINKKDYSMNLIGTFANNTFDNNSKIEFQNSSSYSTIKEQYLPDNSKITLFDFKTKTISGTSSSVRALSSELEKNTSNLEIGLLSILDYVNASTSLECSINYLSNTCMNNNYLYKMFNSEHSVWTLNNNGSQVWYVDIDGTLKLENSSSIKYLYPVIHVNTNTYITNFDTATGSINYPYKLK